MTCQICTSDNLTNLQSGICRDCWKIVNVTKYDIPLILRLLAFSLQQKEMEEQEKDYKDW